MASRKGISYQWRLFVPTFVCFWAVVLGMASWQMYRIRSVKVKMVYDQLAFVGQNIETSFDISETKKIENFVDFANEYYDELNDYDQMSIRIITPSDSTALNVGELKCDNAALSNIENGTGRCRIDGRSYLYYAGTSPAGNRVLTLLPFSKEVAKVLNPMTTKFWFILFGIGLFVSVFAYFTSRYLSRNIRLLRDFSRQVAGSNGQVNFDESRFSHDELGEISRKIVDLYNLRIGEMQSREREHKLAMHAIDEKERIKRELTGNINHELKTPVGVIQGYLDTIVDNPDMDCETRERFLTKAQANVHRLSALIADITAITRLESNDKFVNVCDINMHELAFTFNNMLDESKLIKDQMSFSYDIPLDCVVLANEGLLTTVLLNFTKNAVAYSKGTECRFEYVSEDDDLYYFRYYDNGIGVPPIDIPHLFERFYRVNGGRSRDAGGTGLGLAIVEVTIVSLGGSIKASNRFPSGLQFDFSLPKYKKQ